MAQTEESLRGLVALEKDIEKLQREKTEAEEDLRGIRSSWRIAATAEELDEDKIANLSIIQPASEPIGWDKDTRKLLAILFFGIVGGFGAGIVLALGLDFVDRSLKTSEGVEQILGLPVLVALPVVKDIRPQV